jgi:putrescine transport system permease protein
MKSGFTPTRIAALVIGFGFLYLPIALLVIHSFNESQLVTVWGGFSLRWYRAVLHNDALLEATLTSVKIAALAASIALILGTLSGLALARFTDLRGRPILTGLVYTPLVLPEVILGLSLLLLFVELDWDRGFWTVVLAHATFGSAYVAIIVNSRLIGFDRSLEEAAQDLGAPPARTFLLVTLPIIAPSLLAAWLLAFTLSLDDLVIASFTTGPGATTLPMKIYSQARLGVTPEINAIGSVLIALVGVALIIASLIQKRRLGTSGRA